MPTMKGDISTMTKITCPTCYHNNKYEHAKYCFNCGMTFGDNNCTNIECQNASVNLNKEDCYCYLCGNKTTFFKEGFIKQNDNLPF